MDTYNIEVNDNLNINIVDKINNFVAFIDSVDIISIIEYIVKKIISNIIKVYQYIYCKNIHFIKSNSGTDPPNIMRRCDFYE